MLPAILAAAAILGWWAWWDEVNRNGREGAARDLRRGERLSDTPHMQAAIHYEAQ